MAEAIQERVRTRMTAAEYLQLPESNLPMELINGEIITMPAPKNKHQGISLNAVQLLLRVAPAGGTIRYSPCDVRLDARNVVQPDVFWVSGPESKARLGKDDIWEGAPDLVIEILWAGTSRRDRRDKFRLYQKHGVREYWLVDPDGEYVEVYALVKGKFQRQGVYGPEDTFESAVPGGAKIEVKGIFGG